MTTRPYRDTARKAKAGWPPEVVAFAERFGAELTAELAAQVELGRELAAARAAANLTQRQLAERATVQQAEISRIERGLGNPTRDTLVRLVTAMGARLSVVVPPTRP